MHLGQFLLSLRKRAKKSLSQVQSATNCSRSTAYLWERSGSRPEAASLQALLDLYAASDGDRLMAWRLRAAADSTAIELPTRSELAGPGEDASIAIKEAAEAIGAAADPAMCRKERAKQVMEGAETMAAYGQALANGEA